MESINTRPTALKSLIAHLLENPTLSTQLRILHDLALYGSGDAQLSRKEKDALLATRHLADLLDLVPDEELTGLL